VRKLLALALLALAGGAAVFVRKRDYCAGRRPNGLVCVTPADGGAGRARATPASTQLHARGLRSVMPLLPQGEGGQLRNLCNPT